jgi:8-oxo-dGTP diphosphatase
VINYVLGFAFSADKTHVALILKNGKSVPEHRGKLNGIGGKIEAHEGFYEAMSREFKEETGVLIPAFGWTYRGKISGAGWNVKVLAVATDEVFNVQTVTDEHVTVLHRSELWSRSRCPHVDQLIDLCLNNKIKSFDLVEA